MSEAPGNVGVVDGVSRLASAWVFATVSETVLGNTTGMEGLWRVSRLVCGLMVTVWSVNGRRWDSDGVVGIGVAMVDADGVEGGSRCWKVGVGDGRLL